ncbi:MAG: glycoside hydrolase family 30 beta sandwich domain-containing protein [Saprospiraceae bacterium]
MKYRIYETSASGNKMTSIQLPVEVKASNKISINTSKHKQTIVGFGGSFTESSCHLLQQMDDINRDDILNAYFSEEGAAYSLNRTHINSCDFSLSHYSYSETEDPTLSNFSIDHDKKEIIPTILQAQKISKDGFRLIASPWTAPPWMKDNNNWVGGKLLPKYNDTWALYFSKYLESYKNEGIAFWGITVENEPMGNGNNWESMHFSPSEMTDFVVEHLKPKLTQNGWQKVKILGFDQNRLDLPHWVDTMYQNEKSLASFDGTAIHWYESTFDFFPDQLNYAHQKAPEKLLIQTEACIDAEIPAWQNDKWYWSQEATDWGYEWASADKKYLHPKYIPVYRYANDIINCLNHYVNGWIDWNMVLDRQGGPNWFKNWCVAPVIVDTATQEIYYTPLYYVMAHFSKFIRPEAKILEHTIDTNDILVVSAINSDSSIAVVVFNPDHQQKVVQIDLDSKIFYTKISGQAIQTLMFNK